MDWVGDAGRAKTLDWVGEGEECCRSGDVGRTGGGELVWHKQAGKRMGEVMVGN